MTMLETLRNRVAAMVDPHARRLRGEPFREFLAGKPTAAALDVLRADEALREEMRAREGTTRQAVADRYAADAARAFDEGRKAPEAQDADKEPEWIAHLEWLDATAASVGLPGRGQIAEHLHSRRVVLVAHLSARWASEGEPTALKALRKELSATVAEGWSLERKLKEQRTNYNGLGGASNPEAGEAEVVAAHAAVMASGAKANELRRRLSRDFGVDTR